MTCPHEDKWSLYSLGLLETGETDGLRLHALACPRCRQRLTQARQDHVRLLRSFETLESDHDQQREEMMAALPLTAPTQRRSGGRLGDCIMSLTANRARVAAVALLPAACVVAALFLLVGFGAKVALADVAAQLRNADTMVCDVQRSNNSPFGGGEMQSSTGAMTMYSDGEWWACRYDMDGAPFAIITTQDGMRFVNTIDNTTMVGAPCGASDQPTDLGALLTSLSELSGDDGAYVGDETLNGRTVAVFEVDGVKLGVGSKVSVFGAKNPEAIGAAFKPDASTVRLWIDPATMLPVQIKLNYTLGGPLFGGQTHYASESLWTNIRWNVPVDTGLFESKPLAENDETVSIAIPGQPDVQFNLGDAPEGFEGSTFTTITTSGDMDESVAETIKKALNGEIPCDADGVTHAFVGTPTQIEIHGVGDDAKVIVNGEEITDEDEKARIIEESLGGGKLSVSTEQPEMIRKILEDLNLGDLPASGSKIIVNGEEITDENEKARMIEEMLGGAPIGSGPSVQSSLSVNGQVIEDEEQQAKLLDYVHRVLSGEDQDGVGILGLLDELPDGAITTLPPTVTSKTYLIPNDGQGLDPEIDLDNLDALEDYAIDESDSQYADIIAEANEILRKWLETGEGDVQVTTKCFINGEEVEAPVLNSLLGEKLGRLFGLLGFAPQDEEADEEGDATASE